MMKEKTLQLLKPAQLLCQTDCRQESSKRKNKTKKRPNIHNSILIG